jgi:ketosteroid isomerase-like protein
MTSGVQTFASIEPVPLPHDQIRIFNDNTAVVTAQYKVTGNDHGKDFTMQTRSLATWVKQNGGWQMVAFQATGVARRFQK